MLSFIKNLLIKLFDFFKRTNKNVNDAELQHLAKYIIVVLLSKWSDSDLQLYRTELKMLNSSEYELKLKILNDYKYLYSELEYTTMLQRIKTRFK